LALLLFSQFVLAAVAVAIYSLIILIVIDIISTIDIIVVLMLHFVLPRIYAMRERARYATCTRYVVLLIVCCICHVPMTSATNGDESASSGASGVWN
jgi:hypothetical protein